MTTMQMSRLTAYAIASNPDIEVDAGGPDPKTMKFVGWITLGADARYRPLLNTEPFYDSLQDARDAMTELVAEVKRIVAEETKGKHPFDHVFDVVLKQGVEAQ